VRTANGTTLVLNDLVGNIREASGISGWLLGLAGFAGKSARIPRVVKLNLVRDAKALRTQLLQWAEISPLKTNSRRARRADRIEPSTDIARSCGLAISRRNLANQSSPKSGSLSQLKLTRPPLPMWDSSASLIVAWASGFRMNPRLKFSRVTLTTWST
jgi:hypothetical protein